jgi:Ni,Fe-hydrogenase III small subunit/ferredoxin
MLRLLSFLIGEGVATAKTLCPDLEEDARGLPNLTDAPCDGSGCNGCVEICPTDAILVIGKIGEGKISLDLGSCISCGLCIEVCPSGTIVENRSTKIARRTRQELVLTNDSQLKEAQRPSSETGAKLRDPFFRSAAIRVISTGCSACDLEIGASTNAIFDVERFGISIVASPRFADIMAVTGPVSKGMQKPILSAWEQMSAPKVVAAVGTCAISGGVHKGGYAQANGVDSVLPVNVYIPGCPPHPWSIIHGLLLAMGKEGY